MNEMIHLGNNPDALSRKLVLQTADRQFVAGNLPGRKYHRITLSQRHMTVIAAGDPAEGRTGLALATGTNIENLIGGNIDGIFGLQERRQIGQVAGLPGGGVYPPQ